MDITGRWQVSLRESRPTKQRLKSHGSEQRVCKRDLIPSFRAIGSRLQVYSYQPAGLTGFSMFLMSVLFVEGLLFRLHLRKSMEICSHSGKLRQVQPFKKALDRNI